MKIGSFLAIIVGAALLFCSFYVKSQVKAGQEKIESVEKNVGIGDRLFSLNPATEAIGGQVSKPIKEKVAEGKEQVAFYSSLANWLEVGGVIFVVLGLGIWFIGKK